ncbi:phosphatase PAP2 family protein [Streptomyces pristinaespiralis]|uniref:Integral membrane protein n=2 Tax=Streptomyces pristinaespiralis TaxID=38300 RepID=B5H5L6_STRE2|nr:phosphatase PAP2 family protein [Streptomyces pristinaespiralis]ALC22293.1 membrane protein [Streptomyces pristinaespiralis]EDY62127.1 integral membrane protein [Streptomyces pristinaespiralis ATCC 25486]QMU15083.1 phosphatase PAP2 family protein [Streptomyces pristinaespiralis]
MAGLAADGVNPDVGLLYDINGLAKDAPTWLDRTMEFVGEYGIMLGLVLVVLWCWWSVRRRGSAEDSVSAVAGLIWAPLAAGIALLVNIPIRGFVERPRPFLSHEGLEVLVAGKTDYSFVSDHATMAMAIGAGLFVANRRFGLAALGLAVAEGFCRVYMGVHYPTDVIGGFALGTAVALLLAPLALALLTPLVSAIAGSRHFGWLVRSKRAAAGGSLRPESLDIPEPRAEGKGENGLAA